ncbi:MAG: cyclic nucleotide-binding domain-containing protein [Dehalococcoidia bacterium]|nr:cyclic nucleotide-binding domain-containing protein [Dehalococcoidia bacterium]
MPHEETLASVPLFSRLGRSDLERMGKAVVSRKYAKDEEIVKEGEQAVAFYVIVNGKVGIVKGGQTVNTLGAGDFFGEMALLDHYPRATSVIALDDTECLVMTRWDFTAELRTDPTIALAMLPELSKRIRQLETELDELSTRLRALEGAKAD